MQVRESKKMAAPDAAAGKHRPKQRLPDQEGSESRSPGDTFEASRGSELLAVTISVKTGQVVKVQGVEGAGAFKELSDKEKASLLRETGKTTVEDIIEQAFEAGIGCVLGDEAREHDPPESEKDAMLRHLLVRPLIERSLAKRLMRRDVLNRAFLKTLIENTPGARRGSRE
jgi:hypothetical protein